MAFPKNIDVQSADRITGVGFPAADHNQLARTVNGIQAKLTPNANTEVSVARYEFDTTDGWVTGNGSAAVANGVYTMVQSSTTPVAATKSFTATVGKTYILRVSLTGTTGKFAQVGISDGTSYTQVSVPVMLSSTPQESIAIVKATGTAMTLSAMGTDTVSGNVLSLISAELLTVTTPVMTTQGHTIFKNGAPIRWRGMNHSNVPIGFNFLRTWWQEPKQNRYDLQDIAAGGWDCIKLYADAYDQAGYGWFFDECYRNGIDVWMFVFTGQNVDYTTATGSTNRTAQITAMQNMVNQCMYHPAVVGYGFGNEMNYNLGSVTTLSDWYSLLNQACGAAKTIDANRLTTTSNGDVATLYTYNSTLTNLDVHGATIYRATSFGDLATKFPLFVSKPLLVTEYGYDRYNHNMATPGEDAPGQAVRDLSLTKELDAMPFVACRFLFEWADEWWKESNPVRLDIHDAVGVQNFNDDRDQTYDEEWFGINEALPSGAAQSRVHKQAYYDIQKYQLATPVLSPVLSAEQVANALANPSGFTMQDLNFVRYQIQITNYGKLQITPFFILQPESLTTPVLQMNDTKYDLYMSSTVSSWYDISPSRKTAYNYNPSNQPVYVPSGLNGHGIFRFTPGRFLNIENFPIGSNLSVFIVAANTDAGLSYPTVDTLISNVPSGGAVGGVAFATFNSYADASNRHFLSEFAGSDDNFTPATTNRYINGVAEAGQNLVLNQFYVFSAIMTHVQIQNYMRINLYTDGALAGSNDIAEIIIYQGAMNTTQRNAVENSLKTKYAIS